jgi:hypothetical protein
VVDSSARSVEEISTVIMQTLAKGPGAAASRRSEHTHKERR